VGDQRKAAQPEALKQANPISGQTRGIGRSAQRRLSVSALEGAAGQTLSARSASLRERAYDVISDTDLRDVGTDCGYDPCDLVTEAGGEGLFSSCTSNSLTHPDLSGSPSRKRARAVIN
jgi:hypothetical protein